MLKIQDGEEKVEIGLGCFSLFWKTIILILIVANFGRILDIIASFAK